MDLNEIASHLAALGKEEAEANRMLARAHRRLRAIARQRCAYLRRLAKGQMPAGTAPLSDDVMALVVAPKDEDGE